MSRKPWRERTSGSKTVSGQQGHRLQSRGEGKDRPTFSSFLPSQSVIFSSLSPVPALLQYHSDFSHLPGEQQKTHIIVFALLFLEMWSFYHLPLLRTRGQREPTISWSVPYALSTGCSKMVMNAFRWQQ